MLHIPCFIFHKMLLISFLSFFLGSKYVFLNHVRKFKCNPGCLKVKATDSAGSDGEAFGEVCRWHMGITHFQTYIS